MDTHSELRPGDVVAGRYVIEALLGQSPAAWTYLADENHSRQKLCLKVYRPATSAQLLAVPDFFLKAGVLPALAHDNLGVVYDVQESDGRVYIAREFLDGLDFQQWVLSPGRSASKGLEMLWQAAQSLVFLHDRAYHLNIHPGNLFLSEFAAKLVDPDPRMLSGNDSVPFPLPVRPEYRGYIAPEARRGGTLVYPSTDLYGLAGMFFLLVSGEHPSENPTENHRRITALDREIGDFLAKALHPTPELRFPGADAFSDALWNLQPAMLRISERTPPPSTAPTPVAKTEFFSPPPVASSGTLFGDPPAAHFADTEFPDPEPAPKPAAHKPLTRLEAPEAESTFFGTPVAPIAQPTAPPPPRPVYAPTPPLHRPVFSEPPPPPKPAASSLTSLEMDTADLTLSGVRSESMTQYGFKGANQNQTLALEAEQRRKSRKILWLSIAAGCLILGALIGLFVFLKKSSTATAPVAETPVLPPANKNPEPPPPPPPPQPKLPPTPPTETHAAPFPEENTAPEKPVAKPPAEEAVKPPPPKPEAATSSGKPTMEELVKLVQGQAWPKTSGERLQMGDDLNDYGRVAEANMAYSKALALTNITPKEKVHALGGLAVTFDKMGMKEETLNALDQLLALQPGNRFAQDLKKRISH